MPDDGIRPVLDAMPPAWTAMALCADGHVTGAHGVTACVTPAFPDRSLPNSVLYEDQDELVPQLGALTLHYERAGVRAWTVWVHPGDRELEGVLRARGHVLDATPAAMHHDDLAALGPAPDPPAGHEIEAAAPAGELGALNDAAYGFGGEGVLGRLIGAMADAVVCHVVRDENGTALAGAAVFDEGANAELLFVATAPRAQRQGLGSLVCHHALLAARERGARTSTLEASRAGEGVYARLGYRTLGRLRMWELRVPRVS